MAERHQQMKTSFLFVQLRAPPARVRPAPAPARPAAAGGPEEGRPFPGPGAGSSAGGALGPPPRAGPPPPRPGRGTAAPAAPCYSAPAKGEEKTRALDARRGRARGPPGRRRSPALASGARGRRQPRPCRPPSPAPGMGDGGRSPSVGWTPWPDGPARRDVWSTDPQAQDASECSLPQAQAAEGAQSQGSRGGTEAPARSPARPPSAQGAGTPARASRARLCRHRAPLQTSRSCAAPPAALPLKAETFVWVNNASAHSQSVAKAKYEFLFGRSEEKTPDTSDHGGSTLLPPNVTNEFPEYGTMEGSGEGLRASLEFDAESLLRCPGAPQGAQPLAGCHSGPVSVAGGPKDVRGLPSQSHFKEPSLQPIDSLISALKATEARIASGTLQATKVLDGAAVSSVSAQQGGQEPDTASQKAAKAHALFPAGREKSPDIPLSAKVPTEEHFYLSIREDLTALLTGETQAEPCLRARNGRKGAVHVPEPAGPASSVGSPATHSSAGGAGLLRERRSDQCARGRPGPGKHVAFQGVETLWAGGEEREARHPADVQTSPGRTAPPESREFSQVPSPLVSSAALRDSAPPERPGPPAPLLETVEDEVFLREDKDHVERRPEPEGDGERILEQAEHLRGGDDDILGSGYAEDSTDVYSSQFETILDNTSLYYSAESLETLYSEPDSYFSFEMPLTPMIQQRIKEGGQFLERTSVGGQQDVLSISADGGIVMGYSSGVTNGLSGSSNSIYSKGTPEIAFWGSNAGVKTSLLEAHSEMGSTEILEKEASGSLSNGTSSNIEAAKRLAKRLYQLDRFKRSDVAKHLGKNNEFSKLVAEEYLKFFDFTGMTLDQSLRYFFKAFSLVGETQERERVLVHFSNRYFYCNPDTIASQDGVHCLTCAMMLLNTDLHGHNIGKKMTCQEFIANLQGVDKGGDFSKDLLKALYNSIKNEKLEWAVDDEEKKKSVSEGTDEKANGTHPKTISRIGSTTNPFLDIPHDPNAAVYKSGFLARKIHADMDGKKTPRGKRGWKTFYAVLKGTVLYLQKDEYKPEKALSEEDLKNAVSVHHALASQATDYEKKPNVLKLKTADWRVLLFQAQSPEEMQGWINKINCVAAVFSAPPFPAAIGSQKKFSRPLLPATTTKLSQEEQLKSHETKLRQITTELAEHRSYPPDKKVKAKEVDEYKLKDHYLEFEKTRYEMYVRLLKEGGLELLSGGGGGPAGLKKSHSSPSLNPDTSPVTAKVKRNVSERKDHRPGTPSIKQKVT
ncbi:PH and SEC7 domain-containing protein 3 isoform X4 [Cervus canadensis]|nr:PH and SEC7 domain-containing protein 3 isoform X4 [Cervus canadensis]XP_043310481.1 PH and SEC7 domain-containing protein 3 isoform X4 [Cervus canadensis]XP_043310482.1 PH and SEC7 domain-containing protein 3 isoform X4 [Cervus canadensis]XP_043310483.1 PH and SEC7 domain-containing protein 3 isoform X4 [Cervus canadensis]XP_043310484.1 PH and SEC7 domain-containing protein 3 isoform X4 [Cervus canadensis]